MKELLSIDLGLNRVITLFDNRVVLKEKHSERTYYLDQLIGVVVGRKLFMGSLTFQTAHTNDSAMVGGSRLGHTKDDVVTYSHKLDDAVSTLVDKIGELKNA
jgi:hypothetical protein